MPYSEALAERVRHLLTGRKGIAERKMFGGVGFLLRGHMLVGVWQHSLLARVGPDDYQNALAQPHVREFDITGRAMRGWVLVDPDGVDEDRQLSDWIDRATAFVQTLPAK
jgi:TfoX/Sxy family transcriptional regulator of competence genes